MHYRRSAAANSLCGRARVFVGRLSWVLRLLALPYSGSICKQKESSASECDRPLALCNSVDTKDLKTRGLTLMSVITSSRCQSRYSTIGSNYHSKIYSWPQSQHSGGYSSDRQMSSKFIKCYRNFACAISIYGTFELHDTLTKSFR